MSRNALLLRLPERGLALALLGRGTVIWLLVRTVVTATASALDGRPTLSLSLPASILLVLVVTALGLLDARRRNEDRFLANLGVSAWTIAMVSAIPAIVGELLIVIVGAR